jgi:tetratricopeptide (TPR) repeat protein
MRSQVRVISDVLVCWKRNVYWCRVARGYKRVVSTALAFSLIGFSAVAREPQRGPEQETRLRQHYDAAQDSQATGDLNQAAREYKLFLVDALGLVAGHRAEAGDFARATSLFDEALRLAPDNSNLKLEYAEACRTANDVLKAKMLAQDAVDSDPKNGAAHLVLGRILSQMGQKHAAVEQFELAVAIQPNFTNGYALAIAYLKAKQLDGATKLFSEMLLSFGGKAELHLQFGTAYAKEGYTEQAISEFNKAIAENGSLPGAHYSLGAAYMLNLSESAYERAAKEFQKELHIYPDDYNSHLDLGLIYLRENKFQLAETELRRASSLEPRNPDPYFSLGQLYDETGRAKEAETALRKSIELTSYITRNHYQVARAHYLLVPILLQSNRQEEATKELLIANQLLAEGMPRQQRTQSQTSGDEVAGVPHTEKYASEPLLDPDAIKRSESSEMRIGPAIADSYNNLGVIAAGQNEFAVAAAYFEKAAQWNPSLEALDYNWARAAFSARQYKQAIMPLSRYLQNHPQDTGARSTLALCHFLVHDYSEALKDFAPLADAQIIAAPNLAYAYAVSLTKVGDYNEGLQRLKALEEADPGVADIHKAIGEALAAHADCAQATPELQTAIRLNPADQDAQHELSSCVAAQK